MVAFADHEGFNGTEDRKLKKDIGLFGKALQVYFESQECRLRPTPKHLRPKNVSAWSVALLDRGRYNDDEEEQG